MSCVSGGTSLDISASPAKEGNGGCFLQPGPASGVFQAELMSHGQKEHLALSKRTYTAKQLLNRV